MMGDVSKNMHGGHIAPVFHEEKDIRDGLAVNMNASPVPFMAGVPTRLNFFVNIKPAGVPVPINELEVEHEKLMHVIGVRSDMSEFFHVHPQSPLQPGAETGDMNLQAPPTYARTTLAIDHVFNQPGLYKIWSEIKKDEAIHVIGHEPLSIVGEGAREDKKVAFGRSVVAGGYQVTLSIANPIGKGVKNNISFDIHDSDGNKAALEPYLGADMHLAIIKDDWTEFIHTHPSDHANGHDGNQMESPGDGHADHTHSLRLLPFAHANGDDHHGTADEQGGINFSATFPTAGLYRAFAQFRPAGISLAPDESLVAAFWIKVGEKAPQRVSASAQWWGLLLVSILAMGALSLGVNKYLSEIS